MGTISEPEHVVDFVVGPSGYVSPVPTGAVGPYPTRAPGMSFENGSGGHGFDERTSNVRIMDANANQPARTVYENRTGQRVDPFTGRTISASHPKGHFYHDR